MESSPMDPTWELFLWSSPWGAPINGRKYNMGNWGEIALQYRSYFTPCITVWGPYMAYTPENLTWNPKSAGFEDDSPFLMGDFQVPCSKWGLNPNS